MKKINCKDGLDKRQELEARKIRRIMCGEDEDEKEKINYRLKENYEKYKSHINCDFYSYLKDKDIILYSALNRLGKKTFYSIIGEIL